MNIENEILIWKLTPRDNELAVNPFDLGHPANSLDEASKYLPGGAYTTLRTYSRTKVMRIKDHFQRLAESAQRANAGFTPQVAALRPALRQILNLSPFPLSRIRVTLDLEIDRGGFYVTLERLHTPPEEAYHEGVRAITHRMQRENPKAKLTNFLATASEYRAQLPQGVNEMLMVDQNGMILEGLSSNFYGVTGKSGNPVIELNSGMFKCQKKIFSLLTELLFSGFGVDNYCPVLRCDFHSTVFGRVII